ISTNQAVFVRPGADLMSRGKAQFVEDVLNVGAYSALSDHESLGDLTVAQPKRQQRGYLALARAQSRDLLCRTLWRPARSRGRGFHDSDRQVQGLLCSHVLPGFQGSHGCLSAEGLLCREEPVVEHGTLHRRQARSNLLTNARGRPGELDSALRL